MYQRRVQCSYPPAEQWPFGAQFDMHIGADSTVQDGRKQCVQDTLEILAVVNEMQKLVRPKRIAVLIFLAVRIFLLSDLYWTRELCPRWAQAVCARHFEAVEAVAMIMNVLVKQPRCDSSLGVYLDMNSYHDMRADTRSV